MAAATKFGIGLPNGFPRGEVNPNLFLEVAERAEEYGYDSVWAAAGEFLGKNYNIDSSPFARLAVHGTPDECIAHTRRYIEAGAEHVVIRFASFDPLHQIERWTKEVMPALR